MILFSDELEIARNGGIGVCLSESTSLSGRRHPEAGVFMDDNDRIRFRSFDTDACRSIDVKDVTKCQETGGVLVVPGVGNVTVSKHPRRGYERVHNYERLVEDR